MTLKLRRPVRGASRPHYASGGGVYIKPIVHVSDDPEPAHRIASRELARAGVTEPTVSQKGHVAQAVARERGPGGTPGHTAAASSHVAATGGPKVLGIPASVQAALDMSQGYARGGAVGLPAPMFRAAALPAVATPGLASPRGLLGARHRQHFDDGGDVGAQDQSAGDPTFTPVPSPAPVPMFHPDLSPAPHPMPTPSGMRGGSPVPSPAPTPQLLQNGFDQAAVQKFWGDNAVGGVPRIAASGVPAGGRDGTGPGPGSRAQQFPSQFSPGLQPSPAPALYHPMDDPVVRASLHMARGGVATCGNRPARGAFARGGSVLPAHVQAALAILEEHRRHFEDGGSAGGGGGGDGGGDGGDGGGEHGSGTAGGSSDGGSDGHGGGDNSSSGSAGGVGGFGGSSSGDGYGGGSRSGSAGGVGGFGGGSNDGYGGGNSSSNSNSGDSGSGGSVGNGGFSPGAASGADSAGPTSSGSTAGGVLGGAGLAGSTGPASATSGPVGSIAGSDGAPAAGGFSSPGAPATGGFGSFGATPTAMSTAGGMIGATPTASSLRGETTAQSMASEAAHSDGEAGEDGTTSLGSVPSNAQAFSNPTFGLGPSSPYGAMPSGMDQAPAPAASMLGAGIPASVQAAMGVTSPYGAAPSAMQSYSTPSATAATMASFGPDGSITPGSELAKAATPYGTGLGAYGLSTPDTMGFDNFRADGTVQMSSLGEVGFNGYTGTNTGESYDTPGGEVDGSMLSAVGSLPGAEGYVGGDLGIGTPSTVAKATAPTVDHLGLPDYDKSFSPDMTAYNSIMNRGMPVSSLKGTVPATEGTAAGTTPGKNADGDPTAVGGISALTIHGPAVEAALGGYDAPGALSTFGGITDQQAFNAHQDAINRGFASPQDSAITSGYVAQQNSPVGRTVGFRTSAPSGVAGTAPATSAGQVATTATSNPGSGAQDAATPTTKGGFDYGDYNAHVQSVEDPSGVATNPTTGAYGAYQITGPTYRGIRTNNPDLGLPANIRDANPTQIKAAQNALTAENLGALKTAGLEPTYANAYAAHLLGAPVSVRTLSAPDSTPIGDVVPAKDIADNPKMFRGVQTVGDFKSRMVSMVGSGVISGTAAPATPNGLPASVRQAASPSFGNFSSGAASGMDTTDPAAATTNPGISPESGYMAPAAGQPTTQTVTSPGPYGVDPEVAHALTVNGLAPTSENALAVDTLGLANGIAVMNGPPSDPISSIDISPATIQAHPNLFAGVRTVGDLRGNITATAPTAGQTTSTTTTPGAPGVAGSLPGYSYSSGAASGLDSTDPAASTVGISQPAPDAPPAPARRTTAPATAGTENQPDATAPSHLSIPPSVTNALAGFGLGALGGPIGMGIAGVNTVSGLLGGPTIGSMLNGALAGSGGGAAGTPGGRNDSSNKPGGDGSSSTLPAYYGPSAGSGDGSASSDPASAGASPLDPHADAMAAYQAAIAGRGTGSGATSPASGPRPLLIRGRPVRSPAPTPLYRPMEDPIVRRALGLD